MVQMVGTGTAPSRPNRRQSSAESFTRYSRARSGTRRKSDLSRISDPAIAEPRAHSVQTAYRQRRKEPRVSRQLTELVGGIAVRQAESVPSFGGAALGFRARRRSGNWRFPERTDRHRPAASAHESCSPPDRLPTQFGRLRGDFPISNSSRSVDRTALSHPDSVARALAVSRVISVAESCCQPRVWFRAPDSGSGGAAGNWAARNWYRCEPSNTSWPSTSETFATRIKLPFVLSKSVKNHW